ncbi:MAG: AzlD domain-containing protein [Ilumatobacteraceae bacterium]
MSAVASIAIVLLVGGITYAMRASVIVALAGRAMPLGLERALRYVGPAVLAALAVNLAAGGEGGPSLDVPEAAALVVGGLVAWNRRNVLLTLVAGMATLWVLSALA